MVTPSHNQRIERGVGRWRPALLFALLPILLGLLLLALVSMPAQAQEPSPPFDINQVTPPTTPPAASRGQSSFEQNCAPCHGVNGLGDGPTSASLPFSPTVFADPEAVWGSSPAELFHTTKFGRIERLMPPWRNQLSDEEIWQTVAYAWSLHTNADEVAAGQARYAESCAGCHGESGAGDGPDATGNLPNFGDLTYAMAQSQEDWLAGWQEAHGEIGSEWSLDEQRQVLEYMRTFSYVPAWESGYRPGSGVITGTIVLGTPGMEMPEDVSVTLAAYAQFTEVATFTTMADTEGRFVFTDLAVDPNLVYLASTVVGGVRYSGPIVTLTSEASTVEISLAVYETTDDPGEITVNRADWIIDDQPGALLVVQLYFFGSRNDRTYLGSVVDGVEFPATVAVHVPPGAEQVTFEDGIVGGRFQQVGDLYYDTTPLIPGEGTKQIIVRYLLPYDDTSMEYSQRLLYPTEQVNLLVAELPQLEATIAPLDGAPLQSASSQEFQDRTYRVYQAGELPATEIQVAFNGLLAVGATDPRNAAAGAAVPTATFAPWMAWSIGGLSLLMLAGVLMWSWRSGRVQVAEQAPDLRKEIDTLARQIAQLDDRYSAGKLDLPTWQRQRGQLKARMLEVARRLEESTQIK